MRRRSWGPGLPALSSTFRLIGLAVILIGITATVVFFAKEAFEASRFGLQLWFDSVLPALMPFFALSEILAGVGVIHLLAVLLEPIMRPFFAVPGAGGFALAMGLVSGYPLGAKITADLCRRKLCNPVEGERLVSVANTADPLFMAGVVAAGFFQVPELGAALSIAHYLAVMVVGLAGRWHESGAPASPEVGRGDRGPLWQRAVSAMREARQADGRPFGQLLGDSVRNAMLSMLFIGGTIMLFSVLLQVLVHAGVAAKVGAAAGVLVRSIGLSEHLGDAVIRGLFEITNGTQAAARAHAPLVQRAVMASLIIGWSGLSVHAQVAALTQGTGIRMGPYIRARWLHGVVAAVLTAWLVHPGLGQAVLAAVGPVPAQPWGWAALTWRLRWVGLLGAVAGAGVVAGAAARRLLAGRGSWPRITGFRVGR